ncbi:MAG TPA: hypothetical protein VGI74_27190 [Streptosporangiaceae bacterium]|jgi:hypothetical protein
MYFPQIQGVIGKFSIVITSALAAGALLIGPAAAATTTASALIYNYQFKGTTGTVKNSATGGPVAPLTLKGTWSNSANGVSFHGDTTGNESAGYAKPATGNTLTASPSQAVGFGAQIVYKPPAGATCFTSTPNITQIGKYSAKGPSAQAKIQESGCGTSKNRVLIQCRFSGSRSAPTAPSVTNKLPLVSGNTYDVSCVKSPDSTSGTATITLTVTNLKTSKTLSNHFTVPAIGAMKTTQNLSVGNKYPMAPPAGNFDQFNGAMNSTVYCVGTVAAVSTCLSATLSS